MAVRHFLTLPDLSRAELLALLKRASELKVMQHKHIPHAWLPNRVLGMVFEKSSTRTRVSLAPRTPRCDASESWCRSVGPSSTDSAGRFRLFGLDAGKPIVQVRREGYAPLFEAVVLRPRKEATMLLKLRREDRKPPFSTP